MRTIDYGLYFKAAMKSADFVLNNIPLSRRYSHADLWAESLNRAPKDGLLLEFGVYKGNSIRFFAERTPRTLYGFDPFEGFPEPWTLCAAGEFKVDRLPDVPHNVRLIKGLFADTLPAFLQAHPGPVAFIHLDCDLYSSSRDVLELLFSRMVPGTVMVMDDFLEEPGFEHEQHKAFFEFVQKYKIKFEYIGYCYTRPSSAVAVEIKSVDAMSPDRGPSTQ